MYGMLGRIDRNNSTGVGAFILLVGDYLTSIKACEMIFAPGVHYLDYCKKEDIGTKIKLGNEKRPSFKQFNQSNIVSGQYSMVIGGFRDKVTEEYHVGRNRIAITDPQAQSHVAIGRNTLYNTDDTQANITTTVLTYR